MTLLTRYIGYSVLLLFIFLVAALGAQGWLRQQAHRLQNEAIETKRTQFISILRFMPPLSEPRTQESYAEQLGTMCGGKVTLFDSSGPLPPSDPGLLYFDQKLADSPVSPITARVTFTASPISRLLGSYQRVTVGLLFLGFALLAVGAFFAALDWRGSVWRGDVGDPQGLARAEMGSLTRLAESSAAQTAALSRERDVRRLAEEDVLLKQKLLNQALEGKVRLGHDLHDGIIQSLYASGLTIESVRTLIQTDPAEADRRLAQCVQNLNATIREARSYIIGLAPDNLSRTGFTQAVESLVQELCGGRTVNCDLKIDDEAITALTPESTIEILQITREAISNSLRHGGASAITVRLHRSDRDICLLIQDNGTGFEVERVHDGGHGLGNMRARIDRIGGSLRVESHLTGGTRVILTLRHSL